MPPPPPNKPKPSSSSTTRPRSPETHQSLALRNAAASTLQSYEQLSWHALNRNESLAQTRLHFLSVLAGFTEHDEAAQVDWKTDTTPHNPGSLPFSIATQFGPLGGEGRRESSTAGKGKGRSSLSGSGSGGRASPGRTSLGGEGSVGGSGKKKRKSAGVGS